MKRSELTIRLLTDEELTWVYSTYMEKDFPSNELKPLFMLRQLKEEGINTIYGCFLEEKLVGYFVLAHLAGSSMYLLDYLAVVSTLRSSGIGSQILASIRSMLKAGEYLFIESENPAFAQSEEEKATQLRRLSFYHRAGAKEDSVLILLFGVEYVGLTLSCLKSPSPQQQKADYLALYQRMLPQHWFKTNVAVRLTGSNF